MHITTRAVCLLALIAAAPAQEPASLPAFTPYWPPTSAERVAVQGSVSARGPLPTVTDRPLAESERHASQRLASQVRGNPAFADLESKLHLSSTRVDVAKVVLDRVADECVRDATNYLKNAVLGERKQDVQSTSSERSTPYLETRGLNQLRFAVDDATVLSARVSASAGGLAAVPYITPKVQLRGEHRADHGTCGAYVMAELPSINIHDPQPRVSIDKLSAGISYHSHPEAPGKVEVAVKAALERNGEHWGKPHVEGTLYLRGRVDDTSLRMGLSASKRPGGPLEVGLKLSLCMPYRGRPYLETSLGF